MVYPIVPAPPKKSAQKLQSISGMPWLLLPAVWVVVTVGMFNFIGDGLRDAMDPKLKD